MVLQKTLDSRHSAEELQFGQHESTSLSKYQVQNNRIKIEPFKIEEDCLLRLHAKNSSMQGESIHKFQDQKRYSSHARNESDFKG